MRTPMGTTPVMLSHYQADDLSLYSASPLNGLDEEALSMLWQFPVIIEPRVGTRPPRSSPWNETRFCDDPTAIRLGEKDETTAKACAKPWRRSSSEVFWGSLKVSGSRTVSPMRLHWVADQP